MTTHGWHRPLLRAGARLGGDLYPLVRAADPERRVSDRNVHLCAALGVLSEECLRALAPLPLPAEAAAVARAGALLSLLTKVDDQVIDALDFHGGPHTPRGVVRARTRAWLAPTLRSLTAAAPTEDSARCRLAAQVGVELAALAASPARLARLHAVITRGWQIQVESVALLSAHPSTHTPARVAWITRQISGAWLLMITMVGALPASVPRPLTPAEERAFFGWGAWIQRADALADLGKDTADGLISSVPGRLIWERRPEAHRAALAAGDTDRLYALAAETDADLACLPPPGELVRLHRALARLGAVPDLLAWIRGFLAWRYLQHPACRRERAGGPAGAASWQAYVEGATCLAP